MATGVSILGFPGAWNQVDSQNVGFGLTNQMPPDLALEEQALNRRQQLANVLMQKALQPAQGQMAGRFYVPPTWAQGLAQLGTAAAGAGLTVANDYKRKDLADQNTNALQSAMEAYKQRIAPAAVEGDAYGPGQPVQSTVSYNMQNQPDPSLTPSGTWDIDKLQPDTSQQVQENKNRLAMAMMPQAQAPQAEAPLAGVPQNMNPWTMELIGKANQPPAEPVPTAQPDPLAAAFDQGQQYTRQPFSQPYSEITMNAPTTEGQRPTGTQYVERTPDEKRQAIVETLMMSQHPQARGIGQMLMQQDTAQQEKATQREFMQQEKALDRDVRREGIQASSEMKIAQMENTGQLLRMQIASQEAARQDASDSKKLLAELERKKDIEVAKIGAAAKTDTAHIRADAAQDKPMPARIMTQQQESLDAIGLGSAIESDLKSLENQIDSGKLKLGMVENVLGGAKNFLGLSDENSRNLQSLKATIEKMRNDSLRLNKGVQTEGDAVRAFNELLANLNDPQVVKQRFSEIRAINRRGVELQKRNVDVLRHEYGKEAMDFSGYDNQPAAVGQGGTPPSGGFSDPEKERRYQEWKKQQR